MKRAGRASPVGALRYQRTTEDRDTVVAHAFSGLAQVAQVTPDCQRHARYSRDECRSFGPGGTATGSLPAQLTRASDGESGRRKSTSVLSLGSPSEGVPRPAAARKSADQHYPHVLADSPLRPFWCFAWHEVARNFGQWHAVARNGSPSSAMQAGDAVGPKVTMSQGRVTPQTGLQVVASQTDCGASGPSLRGRVSVEDPPLGRERPVRRVVS